MPEQLGRPESGVLEQARPHPAIAALARLLLRVYFGKIEVVGRELVPGGRPLVFVANHVNSLVDPALLLGHMPSRPRLLATSELWKMAILRPFLAWSASIPIYRRHVEGFDPQKNESAFARCHEVLAAGGHIGIFPEGTSHSEPALVRVKTGVSRIVLEAEERFGEVGTRIVPVGFTFEDRTRFRSSVLIQVGEPIDPAPEIACYGTHPRASVRALTERVRQALEALTLNFPSWKEAGVIARACEIYQQPAGSPVPVPLSARVELSRTFIEGYRALNSERPQEVAQVAEVVEQYDSQLRRHRLLDEQVAATYPGGVVARFTVRSLWLLCIRLPLGAVGLLIHFLPFQAASLAAKRWGGTADRLVTYKVLASMVFYLVTWIAVAIAAGWTLGWPAALLALVVAPWCGGVALRLYLRSRLFWDRARGFLLMRSGKASIVELRRCRREAVAAVEGLVELYQNP